MTDFNFLENVYFNVFDANFSFIISLFSLIMYWLLLKKANESGWKILIPYYGEYTVFKIAKKKNLFWWQLIISIITTIALAVFLVLSILMFETGGKTSGLFASCIGCYALALILSIFLIAIRVKRSIGLAKAFGQSTAFGVGILFLEPVFIAIMALNKDIEYKKECYSENTLDGYDFNITEYQ